MIEIIAVAALAGFVQGVSGFAFGLVAMSLWAWTLDPRALVPMVVIGSLIGQVSSIRHVSRHVEPRRVLPFLIGGAIGTPIGVTILKWIDVDAFRTTIGVGIVAYCSIMLGAKTLPIVASAGRSADATVGLVGGVMNGVCALAGPPMVIWCLMRGWDPVVQRATYQAYFIGVQVLLLLLLWSSGIVDASLLGPLVAIAPTVAISSWIGIKASTRFSERQFKHTIYGLLWISGLALTMPWLRGIVADLTSSQTKYFW